MLKKVMVVVLLGCVGLTAGVAFGTLFSADNVSMGSKGWVVTGAQPLGLGLADDSLNGCHDGGTYLVPGPKTIRHLHPGMPAIAHRRRCLPVAEKLSYGAPSGDLPMGGYVLFGLLAGLSAALGFLVPPTSRRPSFQSWLRT